MTKHNIEKTNCNEFTIGDDKYIAISDFNKLSMGDNISLELMINESTEHNLLSNILPILIRKAKVKGDGSLVPDEFDGDKYNELRELFKKELKVTDVLHLSNFFFNGEKPSTTTTKTSLVKRKK